MSTKDDPLEKLRREWSLLTSSLPGDPQAMGRFISQQPSERRQELERMADEIQRTREIIEARIAALEAAAATPIASQDADTAAWQNQLARMVMVGWVEGNDYLRLEGMMPATWPGTMPHQATSAWLPFSRWCLRHWGDQSRVASVLAFDPRPEFASELSTGLAMTVCTASQHDLLLMTFLARMRPPTPSMRRFAATQGATGAEEALRIREGEYQACLLGANAWNSWNASPAVMLQWMLAEMATRVLYLAIDSQRPPAEDLMASAGWIPDPDAPRNTTWSGWRVRNHGKGSEQRPFAGSHVSRITDYGYGEADRTVVSCEGSLRVSHFSTSLWTSMDMHLDIMVTQPAPALPRTLELERRSWDALGGLHPMLPKLSEAGQPDSVITLTLPGGETGRLPRADAETTPGMARQIAKLLDLLVCQGALPPGLRASDFMRTSEGFFLTRIGFAGYREQGDPLSSYLDILAEWNLASPSHRPLVNDPLLPDLRVFPEGFRKTAQAASSSISWQDFLGLLESMP